jgi:hypothetical protein
MKKKLVYVIILTVLFGKSVYAQGVKNIVRAYQITAYYGNNKFKGGFFCFYDPTKVKIVSKSGTPQSPVVFYSRGGDLNNQAGWTQAMVTAFIPGFTLPNLDKNFRVTQGQDLVIIKKVLDANKIPYEKELNQNSVTVPLAVSAVQSWEDDVKKK